MGRKYLSKIEGIDRIVKAINEIVEEVEREVEKDREEKKRDFGKTVKKAINKKGISCKKLAEEIKGSEGLVAKIINGNFGSRNFPRDTQMKLCIILSIPFDKLREL